MVRIFRVGIFGVRIMRGIIRAGIISIIFGTRIIRVIFRVGNFKVRIIRAGILRAGIFMTGMVFSRCCRDGTIVGIIGVQSGIFGA